MVALKATEEVAAGTIRSIFTADLCRLFLDSQTACARRELCDSLYLHM